MRPGGCGNDPRARLTPGDQRAVDRFRAYLAASHKPPADRTEAEAALVAEMEAPPAPPRLPARAATGKVLCGARWLHVGAWSGCSPHECLTDRVFPHVCVCIGCGA